MTATPAQVADAKGVVQAVLSGATPLSAPQFADDDVLARVVAIVEAADPAWLTRALQNVDVDADVRLKLALQLRGPQRLPLLRALGAPPFLLR